MKKTKRTVRAPIATLTLIGSLIGGANASTISLTDLGSGNWRVQLAPVTFAVTTAGDTTRLVIKDFFCGRQYGAK